MIEDIKRFCKLYDSLNIAYKIKNINDKFSTDIKIIDLEDTNVCVVFNKTGKYLYHSDYSLDYGSNK
jgi:hypothetical protein